MVNPPIGAYSTIIMDSNQNESSVTAVTGCDVIVDGVFLLFNFLQMVYDNPWPRHCGCP